MEARVKFYINKDKLLLLENYGFVRNDSGLFPRFLYIADCGTIQNRIFVYKDLSVHFNTIDSRTLSVICDLYKDDIIRREKI